MKEKVYLATVADDVENVRVELRHILENAGLGVVLSDGALSDAELSECCCSVHILGGRLGLKGPDGVSILKKQIDQAIKHTYRDTSFKVFIWNVAENKMLEIEPEQMGLVNEIRNNIVNNVIFTNIPSPVQLVDDVRSLLSVKEEVEDISIEHQVFFMYNFIDEDEADEIADMLSDILNVKVLAVGEDPDLDYGTVSVRILKSSELAVIFFCEASSWALPFIQQVWKLSGGASSKTPLMMVGDEDNEDNEGVLFMAPNVMAKLMSLDLVPLEIKVAYDKLSDAS